MVRKNVPMVLQMENAECGAASLAMILKYHGKGNISLEQLRIDCKVSRDGVNARGIKNAAVKNGLDCKVFKANPENIKKVTLPAIMHWNMGHFVVLTGFDKKYYYINDPAIGKLRVDHPEFNKSFTGIVLTFEKTEAFVSVGTKGSGEFTFSRIKPLIPQIFFGSFVIACITVFGMLLPFYDSAYIDNIILTGNTNNFKWILEALLVTAFMRFMAIALKEKIGYEIERGININLSVGFMEKILRLPITFFSQRTPGELADRQLGSFETAGLVCKYIMPVFFQSALIVFYCIAAFVFNIYVALIGVAAVLLNAAVSFFSSRKMGQTSAVGRKNTGLYQGSLAAAIDMIETIKSCACEEAMFSRLAGTAAMSIESRKKAEAVRVYSSAAFNFVNLLVSVSILIVGVYEILVGNFSVGTVIGIIGMLTAFLTPIGAFIDSVSAIFNLQSIAYRTDDTMNYPEENIFLPDDAEQIKKMDGSIRVENVCFAYVGSSQYAVKNVNFTLEKGKSIAFTGGSGSGKSTTAKLIAGLYTESGGHIYYGEAEKNELSREYFYSKIAVVNQSIKLYEGTIFENISMWDRDISYEEVVKACKTACVHDEISARSKAYNEIITEDGKNFSGGQRQRFEIARAIVKKPQILILDEATSALDARTERQVMENIRALGITLIIIAHRLSTIRNCDEILVFKDGEIAERGTHDSLTAEGGVYYTLTSDIGE